MSQKLLTEQPSSEQLAESGSSRELTDLRTAAYSLELPNDVVERALAQYVDRRELFRKWLLKQFLEGTHYGFPPYCQPKSQEREDGIYYWVKTKQGGEWFHESRYRPTPSLYKAGADFVIDLMGVRDSYDADLAAWEQMGKPKDTFVMRCRLYSKSTDELLGEGRGVRKVGQKGGDANNAIKMAEKCAKVAAVLNTYGLSDLFTQDLEDGGGQDQHKNPDGTATPNTGPRDDRRKVTKEQLASLVQEWKTQQFTEDDSDKEKVKESFRQWAAIATDRNISEGGFWPTTSSTWRWSDFEKCCQSVGMPMRGEDEIPF